MVADSVETVLAVKVCENGHFLDARPHCPCGAGAQQGHKVSLFLPHDLYKLIVANAATLKDSMSCQIVTMMRRSLDRKPARKVNHGRS